MSTYNIVRESTETGAVLLRVGFGDPAANDRIVNDASAALAALGEMGGKLCLITGPASMPVAFVLAHGLCHRFGAVAVFDPKLSGYVVAVSHDPDHQVGSIIKA